MNATILNREFQHPSDGWYQLEAYGRHPNRQAEVVLVIDPESGGAITNRFNSDAEAGTLRHGHEMLIDHEHFSEMSDQETVAYGWLTRLQNRADGIYGQIRWTGTGQKAVDGGDYRFFSTVYDPKDCRVLNRQDGKDGREGTYVRPMRLDGLSLTNMNNNRGQKPITNRGGQATSNIQHPTSNIQHPTSRKEEFRRGLELAAGSAVNNRGVNAPLNEGKKRMKSVATKLGLSADASEEAVLAEVTKIMNRAAEAEAQVVPITARVTTLENENTVLLSEQIDADLASAGIKDEKIVNRVKPLLGDGKHFKNREERVAFIKDLVPGAGTQQKKLTNRETKAPNTANGSAATTAEQLGDEVRKICNRDKCDFQTGYNRLQREQPGLFRAAE